MSNSTTIDSRQFRAALGSFTTGVTVVTTRSVAGEDVGLTANSWAIPCAAPILAMTNLLTP